MEASTSLRNPVADGGNRDNEGLRAEETDRFLTGNRWPREETFALLKIRSEMGAAFKDSSLKASLWEEVSRKLGELGYTRSAKKCKEKFENIHKYHRRTKEGRSSKSNSKNYKFFEQLDALDNNNLFQSSASVGEVQTPIVAVALNPEIVIQDAVPRSSMNSLESTSTSQSSSSSREPEGIRKKKRIFVEFFEGLMMQVIEKQETLQKKFLEALEKCERERMAREEAWKMQELERIKKERELLAHERSVAAAKDEAVLSFLLKFSKQGSSVQLPDQPTVPVQLAANGVQAEKVGKTTGGSGVESSQRGSSRWPKEEIEALIRLRTNLYLQYQENGPKGPLWEEISAGMKNLGYERNAKRCKEKWENMNKYFKRIKEGNKRRHEDSRTCLYFHQLEALYKDKVTKVDNSVSAAYELKTEELLMQMMAGQGDGRCAESAATEDQESENVNPNQEESRDTE